MSADNVTPIRGAAHKEQPPAEPSATRRNKRKPEQFLKLMEIEDGPTALDLVNGLAAVCKAMDTLMVSQNRDDFVDLSTAAMVLSEQLSARVRV
jgi:hypothetical protein